MKLIVIGGVAGGTSAAAKAKRVNPDLEITLFERSNQVSFAPCGLPYVIGGDISNFHKLIARTPQDFAQTGIQALTQHEVLSVDYPNRVLEVRNHLDGQTFKASFDKLLIATGASALRPQIPGSDLENIFTLRNITDGEAIQKAILSAFNRSSHPKAVIVGGGYIGLEMAEAFQKRGLHVTILEQLPRLLGNVDPDTAALTLAEVERHGVQVLVSEQVKGFSGNGRVEKVITSRGEIEVDLVLLAVGVRPNSSLAASFGVELTPFGSVAVNQQLETNLPGVYAAGDVTEVHHLVSGRHAYIPLGNTANHQGRVAGTNIAGGHSSFAGVVGTAISKVFDVAVGLTGLSELDAFQLGLDAKAITINASDHAGYYPDRRPIMVRLVFETKGEKLLGAQIVGHGDAVKRIDVVAALLHRQGTLEDLANLNLAYAPPFSSVWDPLQIAANAALR
jgi:CoA-dependent NAD(P)H sulfur oxidoreductase